MVFGPVVADEDHLMSTSCVVVDSLSSPRTPGGGLMDQCSYWHDIPSALQATSPNRPGHDLALGIKHHPSQTQCSPAGGSTISVPRPEVQNRQRHADRLPLVSLPDWKGDRRRVCEVVEHRLICRAECRGYGPATDQTGSDRLRARPWPSR